MNGHCHLPMLVLKLCVGLSSSYIFRSHSKRPFSHYSMDRMQLLCMRGEDQGYSSMPDLFSSQDIETINLPQNYDSEMVDNYFMDLALQQAHTAGEKGEVPIGAVIVGCFDDITIKTDGYTSQSQTNDFNNRTTFQVISKAHNLVETNIDASAHAELLALRQGACNIQNWRYPPNSTIYTTLEPCPMCLSAIQAFRIDNIVYGAPDHRLGALASLIDMLSLVKHPFHEIKSVRGGVRGSKCGDIMVGFFRQRRKIAKEKRTNIIQDSP